MDFGLLVVAGMAIFIVVVIFKTAKIVPQRAIYIVERLGKYHASLDAGFHILIPFIDRVAYIHNMKEMVIDVPPQSCITKDNIAVEVDGILYLQMIDPVKASYGVSNYEFACTQLAQTTMRSEVGRIELDRSFEERDKINREIVDAVDKAAIPWGIKVTRHEIKNIAPPASIKDAMEKQMRAEREKRALIAESEGDKQAKINRAEGDKQQVIAYSEAEKMKRINEAEGKAQEIERVAQATACGIREIAKAISEEGGSAAVNLRIAEQYLNEFGKLAQKNNTMIIPSNLSEVASITAAVGKIFSNTREREENPPHNLPK
ncbi:MAG: SPFH/Band 7/PHB domain protein [Oligoflexia bacterium]|nr:SPFH/Band 7/PHB domain protein [Oligoflexia bacterium]MBF0365509.1 SPFH/Band 7/PHB domain protein [Oligoflexia bacterium]